MEEECFDLESETLCEAEEDCSCDSVEDISQGGVRYVDSVLNNIFNNL